MHFLFVMLACIVIEDLPAGSEVVAKYVAVKGGEDLLRETTSYRMLVEIRIDGEKVSASEIHQAKDRHLTVNKRPDGTTSSHGTDGKQAWYVDGEGKIHQLQGDELKDYLLHNSTVHEALEWSKQYETIKCVGRKDIDGKPTYEVQFTLASGESIVRFFDVASGLFVREVRQIDDSGTTETSDISDYRNIKGVLVPHKRTITIKDHVMEYVVLRAETNVPFPEELFAPPTSADVPKTEK